ncbi:MAG: hypothetical protein CMI08_03250 [Oceanospirillaceae bacterium]|uniref:helix-turn-helix transcriptional regulator n=1 Tax=unclassified Thalassolituus TaxID=2624967 RepID=UPI000C0A7CBB|nr:MULTISPECIES: helix-turn-helix transcriptional regulator [unclassified Thalassolituus]MAK92287.1 hypothetical protein [Thalassolituus sp.]MAX98212.1 hypothetical protein [Oceanospirillaceae bacterium]MBL33989.1 hypothetical protein [Oceanospirillaceae bacterium]MBS54210.1 hypothetical protein [Oceanospirillaceae bacterium]|tara:strand:+ start:87 stop:503 length:417 start_codon:yes stop_codon:yes gene_type:complete
MSDARDLFYGSDYKYSDSEERSYQRSDLIVNVTEDLLVAMEDLDISKSELAKRLSKSKAYVSQILDGSRNMTLGTLSDICFALGVKPKIIIPVKRECTIVTSAWRNSVDISTESKRVVSSSVTKIQSVHKWGSVENAA